MITRSILRTIFLSFLLHPSIARRGALIRDGMSSKVAYDNPLLRQENDMTMDPDVNAITSRCSNWCLDPVCLDGVKMNEEEERICKDVLGEMRKKDLYVTLRSKGLAGGKRPSWMRATAVLGEYLVPYR